MYLQNTQRPTIPSGGLLSIGAKAQAVIQPGRGIMPESMVSGRFGNTNW
jgi:hypothetical protein